MDIPAEAFEIGLAKSSKYLDDATMPEIASCVDRLADFCNSFGIKANETVMSCWTRAVIGKPVWAIRLGIENMINEWKWATKPPLPVELIKAIDDVPEYAVIRRARAEMEIAFSRKKMFEAGQERCKKILEKEKAMGKLS